MERRRSISRRARCSPVLLELKQPESALAEHEKSMKIDPNRFNGLSGAAKSADTTHQAAKAVSYYTQLLKNCDDGKHSDRPELRSAKTEVAKKVGRKSGTSGEWCTPRGMAASRRSHSP